MASAFSSYFLPRFGQEDEQQRIYLNKILKDAYTQLSTGGSGVSSVTGTAPIVSSGGTTPVISLANSGVTPTSYTNANITVDAHGLVLSASNGSSGTVPYGVASGTNTYTVTLGLSSYTTGQLITVKFTNANTSGTVTLNSDSLGAKTVLLANLPVPIGFMAAASTLDLVYNGTNFDIIGETQGTVSPLTTKGDLYGFSTVNARVPVGTNGQTLVVDSTQTLGVKWQSGSGSGGTLYGVYASRPGSGIFDGQQYQATDLPINSIWNAGLAVWDEYRLGWKAFSLKVETLKLNPTCLYMLDEASGNFIDSGSFGAAVVPNTGVVYQKTILDSTNTTSYAFMTSGGTAGSVGTGNPSGASIPNGSWSIGGLLRPLGAQAAGEVLAFNNNVGSSFYANLAVNGGILSTSMAANQFSSTVPIAGSSGAGHANTVYCGINKDSVARTFTYWINGANVATIGYTVGQEYAITLTNPRIYIGGDQSTTDGYQGMATGCFFIYGTQLTANQWAQLAKSCGCYNK